MSLFDRVGAFVRRNAHHRDIRASLEHYERFGGLKPDVKQAYSDAGSFRSQVDRLFAAGNTAETGELRQIAEGVVSSTLMNRYYRAADYLSDIVDDLERTTYLSGEPSGERPLGEGEEPHERESKLKLVREAWLVPLKVASIEGAIVTHAKHVGRALPYASLQRFERSVARLFALIEQSERTLVQQRVDGLVETWAEAPALRARYASPALAVDDALACLFGERTPEGAEGLRRRRADQPLRLSTVVPEERQHYLRASLSSWEAPV